jgi:hypothetical protein
LLEEALDGVIGRRRRLNCLVALQSKTMVNIDEHEEIQLILRQFRRWVHNQTKQKAQPDIIRAKNGAAKSAPRT